MADIFLEIVIKANTISKSYTTKAVYEKSATEDYIKLTTQQIVDEMVTDDSAELRNLIRKVFDNS